LDDRNSLLNISIIKRFPGHSSFNGKITEYPQAIDNYVIIYQDSDSEVMSHSNVLKYVKAPSNTRTITKTDCHSTAPFTQPCLQTKMSSIKQQMLFIQQNILCIKLQHNSTWVWQRTRNIQRRPSCTRRCWLDERLRRRNGQTKIPRMLGDSIAIISPSKCISHEKSMGIQIQVKPTWKPEISQPSIKICSQRILRSPRSTLLWKLRSSSFLYNDTPTICTHKYPQLWSSAIRRVCRFHSKQTRLKIIHPCTVSVLRDTRIDAIYVSTSPSSMRHERQSTRIGSALRKRLC